MGGKFPFYKILYFNLDLFHPFLPNHSHPPIEGKENNGKEEKLIHFDDIYNSIRIACQEGISLIGLTSFDFAQDCQPDWVDM